MSVRIKRIETYFPEQILTNEDLKKQFLAENLDERIQKVGIEKRHISRRDLNASDLAIAAGENLFSRKEIKKEEIQFLIYVTEELDYITPPTSNVIQDKLGISKSCGTLDINHSCAGFTYALSIASSLITTGSISNALILTASTVTRNLKQDDLSTRMLFSDAAAATFIESESDGYIGKFVFGSDGSQYDNIFLEYDNFENDKKPILTMKSKEVFLFGLKEIPKLIFATLKKNELEEKDIKMYFFHQANRFLIEQIVRKAKIDSDKVYYSIKDTGNTTSSTIPIGLKSAIEKKVIKKEDKVMLIGFGVGMSSCATVVKI